jgi:hypothetical protein
MAAARPRSRASQQSSKFFRPDEDGPPISMQDTAKERLQDLTDSDYVRQHHLRLLTDSPGYAAFFLTSLDRYERLLDVKPVLIQGVLPFLCYAYSLPILS